MRYFWLTIIHKWFVIVANYKYNLNVSLWQLLKHDLSKLHPRELFSYDRQFFQGGCPDFKSTWLHHQNVNKHHWEYWIPRSGHNRGSGEALLPIDMPSMYVREMIADWLAAARAYNKQWPKTNDWKWLKENWHKIHVSALTRCHIETILIEHLDVVMEREDCPNKHPLRRPRGSQLQACEYCANPQKVHHYADM